MNVELMPVGFSCIELYFLNWVNFLLEANYLGCIRPRKTRSHLWDMWSNGFYFSAVLLCLAPCYTWDREGNMLAPRIMDSQRAGLEICLLLWSPRSSDHLFLGTPSISISKSSTHHTHTPKILWMVSWEMGELGIYSALLIPYWSEAGTQGDNSLTPPHIMPGGCHWESYTLVSGKNPEQKMRDGRCNCSRYLHKTWAITEASAGVWHAKNRWGQTLCLIYSPVQILT